MTYFLVLIAESQQVSRRQRKQQYCEHAMRNEERCRIEIQLNLNVVVFIDIMLLDASLTIPPLLEPCC